MINHLAECLENFKQEDHWKNEHYHNIKDFLENPAEKVLFFWNAFEPEFDQKLMWSNAAAPLFYDKGLRSQDYQVAYFLKFKSDVDIDAENLKECIHFRQIGKDPLEDLLEKME